MIVVGAIDEPQSPTRGRRGIAHQVDRGRLVLDEVEAPFRDGLAANSHVGAQGLVERDIKLDQPLRAARLGLDDLGSGAVVVAGRERHLLALRRVGADDELAALGHGERAEAL
jgi:hypothetical protein